MKEFFKKIWNWLCSRGSDKYICAWAGTIIAAVFAILLAMKVCIVPAAVLAFVVGILGEVNDNAFNWKGMVATLIGGGLIQILMVLPHYAG